MNWRPFAVALALPLAFVALTLAAVAVNRQQVAGEVVLTEREVRLDADADVNSGARLWLSWSEAAGTAWIGCDRLAVLGFRCGVDPRAPGADQYYGRQLPRYAFVAFALDGTRENRSRLVPVDVDRDAATLRRRYPAPYVIVPAVLTIARMLPLTAVPFVSATIVNLDPRGIQIPTSLRQSVPRPQRAGTTPPMAVRIRYGRRWEPSVVAIAER